MARLCVQHTDVPDTKSTVLIQIWGFSDLTNEYKIQTFVTKIKLLT